MDREDIITRVQEETRIKTTRVETLCEYNIDQVQDLHICQNIYEHQFSFLKEYGYINTTPYYTTGTADVTQDSTTVSGTTTVWTDTHVGWIFKLESSTEYYEVAARVGNTEITLASEFIGDTATTQDYELYKVVYDLDRKSVV